jgi:hypothetical protein
MGAFVRVLTVIGVAALLAGAGWAYPMRNEPSPVLPLLLLAAGGAACLLATALYVVAESRPAGLRADATGEPGAPSRLPTPRWWAPVGAVGATDLLFGAMVSPVLAGAGGLLVVAAYGLAGAARRSSGAGPEDLDRATVRAAREIQRFGGSDGSGVDAVVAHVARGAGRITMVGPDGALGDQVLPSVAKAELAVALAGARRHENFPPEVVGRIRTGRYEWTRMAGIQLGGPPNVA